MVAAEVCWPHRRWFRFACPRCGQPACLLVAYETLTIGALEPGADPNLIPRATVEPEDYSCAWSSSGLRVTLGDRRWTVRAADG